MSMLLKREDKVMVMSGKSKGRSGKILRVLNNKNALIIEGLNVAKKHEKPSPKNEQGGIVDKEMPIHISNVMFINPKTNKPVKLGRKKNDKGKNIRVDKKSGEPVDN